MAGISVVQKAKSVPIALLLPDGEAGMFPQAEVRDNAGALLDTLDLAHVAGGLYQASYTMPDVPYIQVTYITYTIAGPESTLYLRDVDIFTRKVEEWDELLVAHVLAGSAGERLGLLSLEDGGRLETVDVRTQAILGTQIIRSATITDAAPTTTEFETDLTETEDGFWNRGAIRFTSGQNEGVIRKLQTYTGATKKIKVRTALPYVPATNDAFDIIPLRAFRLNFADVNDVADQVWDEQLSEHTDVGSSGEKLGDTSEFDCMTDEVDIGKVKGVGVTSVDDFKADVSGLGQKAVFEV